MPRSLDLTYPNGSTATIAPVPRAKLGALDQMMVELQSKWIEQEFSLGDLVADDAAWELMGKIVGLMPRLDIPGAAVDLEPLQSDFEQLGALFIAQDAEKDVYPNYTDGQFEWGKFRACKIYELHHYNAQKKMIQAERLMMSKRSTPTATKAKSSPPKTSPSKVAA